MNSEFQQLADKVGQLAKLAYSLRDENADLRRKLQVLTDDSAAKLQTLSTDSAAKLAALEADSSARLQALSDESSARITDLSSENALLKQRVDEAYQRVSAVLEQLPMAEPEAPTETAEEAA